MMSYEKEDNDMNPQYNARQQGGFMESIGQVIKRWIKTWKHCVLCEHMVKENLMYSRLVCIICYTKNKEINNE